MESRAHIIPSVHGDETTKVRALDAGSRRLPGPSPSAWRKLRARIQAVVRRVVAEPGGAANSIIHAGALRWTYNWRLVAGEKFTLHPRRRYPAPAGDPRGRS